MILPTPKLKITIAVTNSRTIDVIAMQFLHSCVSPVKMCARINDLPDHDLRPAHNQKESHVRRDFSRLSSVRTTSMDFAIFGKFAHASSRIFRVGPEVSS